ncbi:hypothetical protein [Inediibacterium massiliense]|uniref:hypothetical protein n=1 Tax=Inediibacterium massiliense TaxID=1658111 RepID=UPI0018FE846B|nr:hypothetical protein [Inediibacterium massiliense]
MIEKTIKEYFLLFTKLIIDNINDILILIGISFLIYTMFTYVSKFAGYLSMSIVFIILGLIFSKIKVKK